MGRTLTRGAFKAVNKIAWGRAEKVKGQRGWRQIGTLEAKSNTAGPQWREGALQWGVLPMVSGADCDPVIAYGLTQRSDTLGLSGFAEWSSPPVCANRL